jgi:tetratricopeptide (TPR) repeat protein
MVHPEEFRNHVMDFYLKYRRLDAFELLGLSDEASMDDIEKKYVEFSEKYAPWKFKQPGLEDLADKAKELFIAGGKALGELNDPESRKSLIARRQNKLVTRTMEFTRDQFRITTDLLDSETQFQKGKELMDAKKYQEAVKQLQFAHDCDPQNPIYRAELAYCRYLYQPEIQAEKALQELNEALRIDPQCGLATYYAGVIHCDQANFIEAEVYLQNAVKMLGPDDHRPIQALKALEDLNK